MAVSETPSPSDFRKRRGDARLCDVAKAAGISTSYLSMIERGLAAPTAVLERIDRALTNGAVR